MAVSTVPYQSNQEEVLSNESVRVMENLTANLKDKLVKELEKTEAADPEVITKLKGAKEHEEEKVAIYRGLKELQELKLNPYIFVPF
jgi:hypothetical protein